MPMSSSCLVDKDERLSPLDTLRKSPLSSLLTVGPFSSSTQTLSTSTFLSAVLPPVTDDGILSHEYA